VEHVAQYVGIAPLLAMNIMMVLVDQYMVCMVQCIGDVINSWQ